MRARVDSGTSHLYYSYLTVLVSLTSDGTCPICVFTSHCVNIAQCCYLHNHWARCIEETIFVRLHSLLLIERSQWQHNIPCGCSAQPRRSSGSRLCSANRYFPRKENGTAQHSTSACNSQHYWTAAHIHYQTPHLLSVTISTYSLKCQHLQLFSSQAELSHSTPSLSPPFHFLSASARPWAQMHSPLPSPLPLLSSSTTSCAPMLISPHPLPYPPPMLPTLSSVPTPPLPSSLPSASTPPPRPATPAPVAAALSTNALCTIHTSSSGFIVAHKPRNLKVITSHGTFTLAIKVSAEKIKRRANKVTGLHSVYLTVESAADHTGIQPGRKFNRRKHRSLIGTKPITTRPPAAGTPHLQLTGVDDEEDWLYVVETKGGETRGREKQRYVLLRMDGAYKVEVGSEWARGVVQLLDVVLEDHTGVVAINYESMGGSEARLKTQEEASEDVDAEAVDEKHHRRASYPLLSSPPFLRSFPPHSQSQPLTTLQSVHYSTAFYSATHSAPIRYSPDPTDADDVELSVEVDDPQQRASYHAPAASDDEPQLHSTFFPPIFMPPHSFTWPLYPPSGSSSSSTTYHRTQPPPPPPSMQSYPSTSSTTSSSSSSSTAPTQRTLGHHVRHWSSGSASSLVSSAPYSPSSHTSSSSSVSYSSSSASSTPTHFHHGYGSGSGGSWGAPQQWLLSDSPAPSLFGSQALPSIKQTDTTAPESAYDGFQADELGSGVDALFLTVTDSQSPEPVDADTLFNDCYSPLSGHSLTDSTAWSPTLSSTGEPSWPELPDDMDLALPAAFLSLPPTPPPTMVESIDNTDAELFCVQTVVCMSFCVCTLFICLNAAAEWRQRTQQLSFG